MRFLVTSQGASTATCLHPEINRSEGEKNDWPSGVRWGASRSGQSAVLFENQLADVFRPKDFTNRFAVGIALVLLVEIALKLFSAAIFV